MNFINFFFSILLFFPALQAQEINRLEGLLENVPNLVDYSYSTNPYTNTMDALVVTEEKDTTKVYLYSWDGYDLKHELIEDTNEKKEIENIQFDYLNNETLQVTYDKQDLITNSPMQAVPRVTGFGATIVTNRFIDNREEVYDLRWDRYVFTGPQLISTASFFEIRLTSPGSQQVIVGNVPLRETRFSTPVFKYNNIVPRGATAIFFITPFIISGSTTLQGVASTAAVRRI